MTQEKAVTKQTPEILTKPLPQILDEIQNSIRLAEDAAKSARISADEALRTLNGL